MTRSTAATTLDYAAPAPPPVGPTPTGTRVALSVMMFLQYAIWGAWLPLIYRFLTEHRHFAPLDAGLLISIGATGALAAPFIAGQIADRWFNTEKFLGISHLVGAVLVWQMADVERWTPLMLCALAYSLVYTPTLALTNSLTFHHLADRDRDFGKVRVWGTIGWITAGIVMGQWLFYRHTPTALPAADVVREQVAGMGDSLRFSAILGAFMGVYCFMLPKTPPRRDKQNFAAAEALAEVLRSPTTNPLLVLFFVSFFVGCVHQFYFVQTPSLLGSLHIETPIINRIFGVGGGGLMTIGQMSELVVLSFMPFVAQRVGRKTLLTIGLMAYSLRFFIFAYVPHAWAILPALALHGVCFGCFVFISFMIVDEQTSKDVRASAQGLYNLVIVGFGVIVGNLFAGYIGKMAKPDLLGPTNFRLLFSIPMWISLGCLVVLTLFYPRRRAAIGAGAVS